MPRKGSKLFRANPIQLHVWGSSHTAANHFLPEALTVEMSDPHFKKFAPAIFHPKPGGLMHEGVVTDLKRKMSALAPEPQCHVIFYGMFYLFQKLLFFVFC